MEQALQSQEPGSTEIEPARPAWRLAIQRHRAGDAAGAVVLYERHLKRDPQDAEAWMTLGAELRRTARPDAAMVCYQRALRLRPDDAAAWCNIGMLWQEMGEHEQSLHCHVRALRLAPRHAQLRLNCARTLREAGRFAEAEELIEQCLAQEPERPDLLLERARLRLQCGRYAEAWPDFEARLLLGPRPASPRESPRWRGERIGGKRLLLLAEDSLSETIWAARFVALLARRGADLALCCPAALHPVLAALGLRLAPARSQGAGERAQDYHCHLLSLAGVVDPRGATIPGPLAVAVPEASRVAMRRRVVPYAGAFRIGVAWNGACDGGDPRGIVPLAQLLSLGSLPGVQLFALADAAAAELRGAGAAGFVVDLGARCRHLGDTAAAVEQMDLLVCSDGPVAHLAASMDKPVLALLPFSAHWIYGRRGDSTPWYPTMRLLRQKSPGDWSSVCAEVLRLVGTWASARLRPQVRLQPDLISG